MDHEDCCFWKLNQIKRVVNKCYDPWLGEAIDAITQIMNLDDEQVNEYVLDGRHFELEEKYFRD